MVKKVGPWRSTAVAPEASFRPEEAVPQWAIMVSARQGVAQAIRLLGLGRPDYVGIPDYASHCVIDFVGRYATPVPMRFLPPERCRAVLLYDQWGWQKPADARQEVKQTFRQSSIIWDRVDSLPESFHDLAKAGEGEAGTQIFSLSKTLGVGGGGLVWLAGQGWLRRSDGADGRLVGDLNVLLKSYADDLQAQLKMDRFFRNESDCWPPNLARWLQHCHLSQAVQDEHKQRRARLEVCLEYARLPAWAQIQAADLSMPAPGVFPLPVEAADPARLAELNALFETDLPLYHFDYSDSYLRPEWKKVLALPLHSEIETERLKAILEYAQQRLCG